MWLFQDHILQPVIRQSDGEREGVYRRRGFAARLSARCRVCGDDPGATLGARFAARPPASPHIPHRLLAGLVCLRAVGMHRWDGLLYSFGLEANLEIGGPGGCPGDRAGVTYQGGDEQRDFQRPALAGQRVLGPMRRLALPAAVRRVGRALVIWRGWWAVRLDASGRTAQAQRLLMR
jgi:hypothetical protein